MHKAVIRIFFGTYADCIVEYFEDQDDAHRWLSGKLREYARFTVDGYVL